MTYGRFLSSILGLVALLWVLVTPQATPGYWGWSIIGSAETQQGCEAQRMARLDWRWTICAEMKE